MPGSTISENLFPVAIKQTTLHKFIENIRYPNHISELIRHTAEWELNSLENRYHLMLEADNRIEIKEKHCQICNMRLIYNGYNDRKIIYDKGGDEHHFRLHRKRCPECGEIKIDLSKIVPPQANYHHNFRRRVRQLYSKGLIPARIKESFSLLIDQWVPESTVNYWLRYIEDGLHTFLQQTPVLSSGKWGYDEIHLRIRGQKRYALTMVDTITKFAIYVNHTESINRYTIFHPDLVFNDLFEQNDESFEIMGGEHAMIHELAKAAFPMESEESMIRVHLIKNPVFRDRFKDLAIIRVLNADKSQIGQIKHHLGK